MESGKKVHNNQRPTPGKGKKDKKKVKSMKSKQVGRWRGGKLDKAGMGRIRNGGE